MIMAKINICRKKSHKQYEIELKDTTGKDRFEDEYGFGTNPPIVMCAKSGKDAKRQLKLPKGVQIRKIKRG
jgi:hypothetical protein